MFGCVLVVFSTACLFQSYKISGFNGLSEPGIFPMIATAAMLASALVILRDTLKLPSSKTRLSTFFAEVCSPRFMIVVAMSCLYLLAMPWLGFTAASGIFLFSTIAYLWQNKLVWSLAVSVLSITIIYMIFRVVFQVVLPQGTLWQGLF